MDWRDAVLLALLALNVVNVWWARARTQVAKKKLEEWDEARSDRV